MPFTFKLRQFCVVLLTAAFTLAGQPAFAQSNNGKPPEPQKPSAEALKEGQKKIDEMADAAKVLTGAAGNPECVWLGTRVVGRLVNDDLDTAFRHLEMYDRFGCPNPHVQAAFRCMARQGKIDLKAQTVVVDRVYACWLNPGLPPEPVASASVPPSSDGTSTK
jgi:hypothetical protein